MRILRTLTVLFCFLIAGIGALPMIADAYQVITTPIQESFAIVSGAGQNSAAYASSDMVYSQYSSDGWGWCGGAGSVQGSASVTDSGGNAIAANEVFGFTLGTMATTLNNTYGAGNWTITDPTLTFWSSGAVQNNSRFGVGSGSYSVYWVGNNNWSRTAGTQTNIGTNPPYVSSQTALNAWAGSSADLADETFTTGTGYVYLTDGLSDDPALVNAITSGSTQVSLYLMGTDSTIGMVIFTGGQQQSPNPLPMLSFNVVEASSVPIPGALLLLGPGLAALGLMRRRSGRDA